MHPPHTHHTLEANFDGLVGPTHNYAGLSHGNLASTLNRGQASSPRAAALQGLAKARALADLGLAQGIIPPHERPHVPTLRALGFSGSDAQVVARAAAADPALLALCCSASSMWTANAATVTPSVDAADGRVHLTPANLISRLHRAIEPATTARLLAAIFPDPSRFTPHPPLPPHPDLGDEGAANHTRLCEHHGAPGVHLFVYGRHALRADAPAPARFPARQTAEACAALARRHRIDPARVILAQQHPDLIDAGVFHNDVIAVGNARVLLYHERAFLDGDAVLDALDAALGAPITRLVVRDDELDVDEAVASYLFNSQLISDPDSPGSMTLIAPIECQERPAPRRVIDRLLADDNPLRAARYLDLRQSMRNGGGPACLRLRVPLTADERAAVNPACWLTPARHADLVDWVERHYPDRLLPHDLADPALLTASRAALDDLTQRLGLGSVYDFQREPGA